MTPGKNPLQTNDPVAFAVDFATLAREIAQDVLDIDEIIKLHNLSEQEWLKLSVHPKFTAILADMVKEWNSAGTTAERIKVKAQTGLETQLEVFIADMGDASIPLSQRTEAARMLARLGELDGQGKGETIGQRFIIQLNIGATHLTREANPTLVAKPKVIEHGE